MAIFTVRGGRFIDGSFVGGLVSVEPGSMGAVQKGRARDRVCDLSMDRHVYWVFVLCGKLRPLFCDLWGAWWLYRFAAMVVLDKLDLHYGWRVQCGDREEASDRDGCSKSIRRERRSL